MSVFSVKTYTSNKKELWDSFISEAKNATFLFQREFMEYHSDRFMDHSLMIYKNEKLVAVLPANIKDNILYSHQGLTYGGLVFSKAIKFNQVLFIFKAVLEYLESHEVSELFLKTLPSFYSEYPNDEALYLAFLLKGTLIKREALSVVNMKNSIKLSKDRIAGAKRGVKNKLIIKEEGDFSSFWNSILIPNLNKKHNVNPVHSLDEITLLKQKFPKNIRQFNVYKEGQIVAGATIFETNNVAHSQYISGNELKNTLGSLDFLHAYLLKEVFASKSYFDFGISNENNGENINSGLQYWKEGFGARTIIQDFYSLKTKNHHLLDQVLQ